MLVRTQVGTVAGSAIAGFCLTLIGLAVVEARSPTAPDMAQLKSGFRRPSGIPIPDDNPPSPSKIDLGSRLFRDPRLSANGSVACSTCHDPKLGFADGARKSTAGVTQRELRRHTPSLWNLAWAPVVFWDGRAGSLEEQVLGPITHPDEMASSLPDAARRLSTDATYLRLLPLAFPGQRVLTGEAIAKSLAAFERTLVSPPTRFDAWIEGDAAALDEQQLRGFTLFVGKAGCSACHTGFSFTDHAFHDIGLPGTDPGRGEIAGIDRIKHAFKTPTLRELAWTAPYMHDGSLETLDEVIRHYEGGGIARPSRSPDMPRAFSLSGEERADLIAFLEALSSDQPPLPSTESWTGRAPSPPAQAASQSLLVSQRGKMFSPAAIKARRGQSLTVLNDDTRTHNVRIVDRAWNFNSGAQDPGESSIIKLDHLGRFEAHCAIHPTMRLSIDVE